MAIGASCSSSCDSDVVGENPITNTAVHFLTEQITTFKYENIYVRSLLKCRRIIILYELTNELQKLL